MWRMDAFSSHPVAHTICMFRHPTVALRPVSSTAMGLGTKPVVNRRDTCFQQTCCAPALLLAVLFDMHELHCACRCLAAAIRCC